MNMDVELDGLFRHNSTYDYDDNYEYNEESESEGNQTLLIPVLYSVEFVIGLLGNGLLLAVLARKRQSWSRSDTFILHLCVSDVLLLTTLPFLVAQATQHCEWCFEGFLCKISGAIFNINFYCGILLLACISVDRFLSVVRNTKLYSKKRSWLAHISCLLVWLCSLILTIPDWIFVVARKDPLLCVHKYSQSTASWHLGSRLVHHMVGFLLPAFAVIFCCSCILIWLQRSTEGILKQRSTIVFLLLVVVFLLCWMPYNITLIVDTARGSSNEDLSGSHKGSLMTALMVTSALGCIHACLRPLLYLCLCRNFRKHTLAVLRCTTVERESSVWELGVGEETPPDQSHGGEEELKQMTCVDHQVQSTQC